MTAKSKPHTKTEFILRKRNVYIHAEETGDKRRNRQNNRHDRQCFHDMVDVVVDNGSKSIHRAVQNISERNAFPSPGGFQSRHLPVRQCLLRIFVNIQPFEPFQNQLIGIDTGGQINQRFAQIHQLKQFFVTHRLMKPAFDLRNLC